MPAAPPPALLAHPDYEYLSALGKGGMGDVFLVRNRLLDRREVLKVLSPAVLERAGSRERFLQEIRSAARLAHPNVVTAYAAVRLGDALGFAMEYVPGGDLDRLVRAKGRLPVATACGYLVQACHGLQHAHERGMVHRDVKPGNLMRTRADGRTAVKVLDFGLAKAASEEAGDTALTGGGQVLGTPDYMAPEQARDPARADTRADLYALGCTLYFLLAGRPPFPRPSLLATLDAHRRDEPEPLGRVRGDLPAGLAEVVARLMAKRPADRYQTPAEAEAALLPFARKPAGEPPSKPALRLVRPTTVVGGTLPLPARTAYLNPDDFDPPAARPSRPKRPAGGTKKTPAWLKPAIVAGSAFFALNAVLAVGLLRSPPSQPAGTAEVRKTAAIENEVGPDGQPGADPHTPAVAEVEPATAPPPPEPVEPETPTAKSPVATAEPGFRPLFDGKTLDGWRPPDTDGSVRWSVEGGLLTGRQVADNQSHLFTSRADFANFVLRGRCRYQRGLCGGIFFRGGPGWWGFDLKLKDDPGVLGALCYPDRYLHPLNRPAVEPNSWMDVEIDVRGRRVGATINGWLVADHTGPSSAPHAGPIQIQVYGSGNTIQFERLDVRELPPAATPASTPPTTAEPKPAPGAGFVGGWAGRFVEITGNTGPDTLDLERQPDGTFTGRWCGYVQLAGKATRDDRLELLGAGGGESYRLTATLRSGVVSLAYQAVRDQNGERWSGQSALRRVR